jgi:hypothetical protein
LVPHHAAISGTNWTPQPGTQRPPDARAPVYREVLDMAATATYPVHVQGRLDDSLSRWLWLVKWLLALPHYIVLAFLWMAFAVLTLVAFFAILITGQYPRAIFDFNLGVLRWQWRVSYYAYGALGTDRYPPFTLADVPDYPARLDVAYPEHLSRGLVLVKWLLGLPHYLIVGLFVGGGAWLSWSSDDRRWEWGSGGLVGLLVLVAAVVLAFSGQYPRSLFDIILGMNRWALRVLGYAALMTDTYPPFRLDMGGDDPDGVLTLHRTGSVPPSGTAPLYGTQPSGTAPTGTEPTGTAPTGGQPPAGGQPRAEWTPGRITGAVVGALLALTSTGLLAGGGALAWVYATQRDDAGYLTSDVVQLTSDGYALRSADLILDGAGPGWAYPRSMVGSVRVRAQSATGAPVFVAMAPADAVDGYLSGVRYTEVVDLGVVSTSPIEYRQHDGSAPATAPTATSIWAAQATGSGRQTLLWNPEPGNWSLVAMNADGSRAVTVDVDLAAQVPAIAWVAVGLILVGLVLLAGGATLVAIAAVRASRSGGTGLRPSPDQGPGQGFQAG